jgi:hypothetical protein
MAVDDLANIGFTNFVMFISFSGLILLFSNYIPLSNMALVGVFCLITFGIQWALNCAATQNNLVCGNLDVGVAFLSTLMPWALIVIVGNLFLFAFPGWVRVFSNTIGMWISFKVVSGDKLNKNPVEPSNNSSNEYINIFNEIKDNPQIIINEIDIIGHEDDQEKIDKIFTKYESIYPNIFKENKEDVKQIIILKNKIGYIIWNMLFGLIAVMVSTNTLLNSGCSVNLI